MTTKGSGELPARVCDEVDFMVRVAPVRPDGSKGLLGRLKPSEHEKSFCRSRRKNPEMPVRDAATSIALLLIYGGMRRGGPRA